MEFTDNEDTFADGLPPLAEQELPTTPTGGVAAAAAGADDTIAKERGAQMNASISSDAFTDDTPVSEFAADQMSPADADAKAKQMNADIAVDPHARLGNYSQNVIDDMQTLVDNSTNPGGRSMTVDRPTRAAEPEQDELTKRMAPLAPSIDRIAATRNDYLKWKAGEDAFMAETMAKLDLTTDAGREALRGLAATAQAREAKASSIQTAFESAIGGELYSKLDPDRERPMADRLRGIGMSGADAARRAAEHGSLDSMLFGMSRTTGDNVGAIRGKFIELGVLTEDKETGALSMPRGQDAFMATFNSIPGGKSSGKGKGDDAPELMDPETRVKKIKAIDSEIAIKPNSKRMGDLQEMRNRILDAGGSNDLVADAIGGIQKSGTIKSEEFAKTHAAGKIPTLGKDGFMLPADAFSRGDQDDMLSKIAIDDGEKTRIVTVNPGELEPVYAPTGFDPYNKLSYRQLVVGGKPQKGFVRLHPTQAAAIVSKGFGSNPTGSRGILGNIGEAITDMRENATLGAGVERSEDDSDIAGSFIGMPKGIITKVFQSSPLGVLKPQDTALQKWTRDFNRAITKGGEQAAQAADTNPYKGMMKF